MGSPLNFEDRPSYTVIVVATNSSGEARKNVTINVTDVDEAGKVTLSWRLVSGSLTFKAKVTDPDYPDGFSETPTWKWERLDSYNGSPTPIQTATSDSYTEGTDDDGKYLRVTATYDDEDETGKEHSAQTPRAVNSGRGTGTMKFDSHPDSGYRCPRHGDTTPTSSDADFCLSVPRSTPVGERIYYPASVSYGTDPKTYPDPGEISYSPSGTDDDYADYFEIVRTTGELQPKQAHLSGELFNDDTPEVTITATDLKGRSDSIKIDVRPGGGNLSTPVVTGPREVSYPENGTWQVARYTAANIENGQAVATNGWIISGGHGYDDEDFFRINDDGVLTFIQPPDFENPSDEGGDHTYSISIMAYDSNPYQGEKKRRPAPGKSFFTVKVTVVDKSDETLEIDGPTVVPYPENSTHPVATYRALQTDGTLEWMLSMDDDNDFSLSNTGVLTFNSPPDYESFNVSNDEHIFLLSIEVTDGTNTQKIEPVRIVVTNVNEPPEFPTGSTTRMVGENANSGENIGDPVEAEDPDDDSLTYTLGGPDASFFEIDSYSGQLQTKTGVNYGDKNSYSVIVSVTDGADKDGNSDTTPDGVIDVTITTTAQNDPPVFDTSDPNLQTTLEVPENTGEGVDIGSPIAATDEDNLALTYTLEGADAASFEIVGISGQIKTKSGVTYDFEAVKAIYFVTVKASDGNASDTIGVTINLTDVNESPTFPAETATRTVDENTVSVEPIGAPFVAADPDSGDSVTYSPSGNDASYFELDENTGQLRTKTGENYSDKPSYAVTVTATDLGGLTDTITVTITTNQENDAPVFDDANLVTALTVDENTPANTNIGSPISADDDDNDTLTYSLEGNGQEQDDFNAAFVLNTSTGQITVKANDTLDYETKASYFVTVKADDNNGGTDTIDVTIDITNVDEPGTVTFSPTPPKAGTPLQAMLTDPDGGVSLETWVWESNTGTDGAFEPIAGAVNAPSYTPTASGVGQLLKVSVTYTDDEGPDKPAEATTAATVIAGNTPPTFTGGNNPNPITFDVPENSVAATVVGTVSTTDSDTDPLTYSLEGTQTQKEAFDTAFLLDTSTGQITVLADDTLDHEATPAYTFEIGVSDGKDASGESDTANDSTVAVTINVTDLNDPPVFDETPNTRTVPENSEANQPVGATFTANDEDNDSLTYTLEGADKDSFTIDNNGQINTKEGVTYDHETQSTYEVTVSVHDGKNEHGDTNSVADDTIDVTITVSNQDEPGTVTFSNQTPQARTELTASLEDQDGVTSGTTTWRWSISNIPGGTFAPIDGATNASYTPVDADSSKYLRAIASYTDGYGADKTAQGDPPNAVVAFHNPNADPTFPGTTPSSLDIAENTLPGQNIGTPVTATDANLGDTLTYSLDTGSQDTFAIVPGLGQIQTKGDLDHETNPTYTVTVTATDPSLSTGTINVTINVTDVDEPPGKPDAPTLSAKDHSTLTATLTAPTNTGPALTNYTFAHRKHDVEEWETQEIPITLLGVPPTTRDITMLLPETTYFARFQATNDEGTGEWSQEGEGTTDPKPETDLFELTVEYDAATYSVTERQSVPITVNLSAEADRKLSIPITDTVGTAESGDYTLGGLDASNNLAFVPGESSKTFTITVTPDSDSDDETLNLAFGTTLPTKVTAGMQATATVTIYDRNPVVNQPPPPPPPRSNEPPGFPSTEDGTRSVAENTEAGQKIGSPVKAVDTSNDPLTYTFGGTNGGMFGISNTDGQLLTKAPLDYESGDSYTVIVTATDQLNAEDSIPVTIGVTDVNEPPGKPAIPTVAPASTNGHNTLAVTWQKPGNTGPPITSYSVEYRKKDTTEWSAANVTVSSNGAGTSATISGVAPSTTYEVQVNATNDEGTGEWSDPGTGTSAADPGVLQPEPVARYLSGTYSVREGDLVTITVGLSPAADRTMSIPVTVTADTAEQSDYTVSGLDNNNLAFSPGNASKSFTITANQDADTEAETVTLGLGALPSGVSTGSPARATLTIADDDIPVVKNQPPPRRRSGLTRRGGGGGGGPTISSEQRPPVFMEGPTATRTVQENTLSGANIGFPVTATDPNQDTLTYTLTGTDRASFGLNFASGQLLTSAALDYESKSSYTVTVTVSDGRGGKDTILVTINVTDVAELPYDPATQAVALVTPGGGATVTTPDGTGTAVFPAGTRDASYYVRIDQGTNDCARDAPDGDHHVYVTVEIFDLAGNLEEDVTLDQPVTILLRIDSADLGGLETAQAIYQHDGIRVYTRDDSGEEWTDVDFTWAPSDTGIITVFITGITNFSCFVVVADASVLPPPPAPVTPTATPTPTPEPTPVPVAAPVIAQAPPPPPPSVPTGPEPNPVYPPVSEPKQVPEPLYEPPAPPFTFKAIGDFAGDIPTWLFVALGIASAIWAAILRAYVIWRRNHPPPPRYRTNNAEIGRDVLVPTG